MKPDGNSCLILGTLEITYRRLAQMSEEPLFVFGFLESPIAMNVMITHTTYKLPNM